jgi:hypothetical protein
MKSPRTDSLTLMRGQVPVTSLLSAFGGALRETRLTSMLGYLIAHEPGNWSTFLEMKRPISYVGVEIDHDRGRADILVHSPKERLVIEAKTGWSEQPRLVFNPPISKDLLQKGKGYLSRRTFSFDELFDAWGKSSSVKFQ